LLRLQLDDDADLRQVVGGQLVVAPPRWRVSWPVESRRREPARGARLGQKPFGLGWIVADQILGLGRVDPRRVQLPLLEWTRDRPAVDTSLAVEQRVVPALAVDGERHGPPDANVVEGRLVGTEIDDALPDDLRRRDRHLGVRLLERLPL